MSRVPGVEQLPLEGLFDLPPTGTKTRDQPVTMTAPPDPPGGVIRLHLPNWSTAWEPKTGRGGWPKLNPKTGKPLRWRPVWEGLHSNARPGHWAQRAKATRTVIQTVVTAAHKAGLTPCTHLTVQLVWAPGDHRTADRGNLMGIHKACLDALARGRTDLPGLQLVPNDSDRWVEELMPRIDRPPVPAGLWLEVQQR